MMAQQAPQASADNLSVKQTETPCVGICSTIYGDNTCRGCFRSAQEVVDWNAYATPKKLEILDRLNQITTQITSNKLYIFDPKLLQTKCEYYSIKIRSEFSPFTWAHALLRDGLHEIKDIKKYGIEIKSEFAHLKLSKLIEIIDDEIFNASLASPPT